MLVLVLVLLVVNHTPTATASECSLGKVEPLSVRPSQCFYLPVLIMVTVPLMTPLSVKHPFCATQEDAFCLFKHIIKASSSDEKKKKSRPRVTLVERLWAWGQTHTHTGMVALRTGR